MKSLQNNDTFILNGIDIDHLLGYISKQFKAGVDIAINYKHYLDYMENYEFKLDDFDSYELYSKEANIDIIQFEFRINGLRVGTKIIRDYAIKYSNSSIYALKPIKNFHKYGIKTECEQGLLV